MVAFGSCFLQFDPALQPNKLGTTQGDPQYHVTYNYQASNVRQWPQATRCKSFTSGVY